MPTADYIAASDGTGEAVRAIVTTQRLIGSVTIITDSVDGWPNKFVATSGTLNVSTGLLEEGTVTVFKGHLTGSIITIDDYAPGYSDEGHEVGQVIVLKPTTLWADLVKDYLDTLLVGDATTLNGFGADSTPTANNILPLDANGKYPITVVENLEEFDTSWIAPTFTNSWVNYGGAYNVAGYRKDSEGWVHLRGLVKSGTDGASIFTLPAGYRPEYQELIQVISADASGRLDIHTNGNVTPQAASTSPTWISLDNIIFKAYQ